MNKQQHQPSHSIETSPLMESLAENPLIHWVSNNGRALAWILLGVLALAILAYRLLGGSSGITGEEYFQAEGQYQAFQTSVDPKTQKDALDKLAALLRKHPDLQSKYDGLIAQTLLVRGDYQQALPFAERTLERTGKDRLNFYNDYANTTLLIADKKYAEALKAAESLKQQLATAAREQPDRQDYGDMLYAFNLLRLAILQQALGAKAEELKAWQEFKQAAVTGKDKVYVVNPQAFDQMVQQLGDGNVSLINYIESREKILKQ